MRSPGSETLFDSLPVEDGLEIGFPNTKDAIECIQSLRRPLSQVAFLAGSGISVASGLPTGWAFNEALAGYLCNRTLDRRRLLALLITGKRANPERQLRFERVVQVLRETVDPNLSILDLFETSLGPSFLHHFLAHALQSGASVFTTNFDCLIEAAYFAQDDHGSPENISRPSLTQVIYETRPARLRNDATIVSFRGWLRRRPKTPSIFKLHGSVHHAEWVLFPTTSGTKSIDSVNATLDSIGNRKRLWSLEKNKARVLEVQLKNRLLVMLGYSGLDDFDVVPTLLPLLGRTLGIVLLLHKETDRITVSRVERSSGHVQIPPSLVPASAAGVAMWIISGRTDAIVRGGFLYSGPLTPTVPSFIEYRLMNLPQYKGLPKPERRRTVARFFEVAGDLGRAEREYHLAIKQLSHLRHLKSSLAYCYNRLGAIQWRRGSYKLALASMKRAEMLHLRQRNRKGVAGAVNNQGYVHMSMGHLAKANNCFRHSYGLHKKLGDRAAMARNLANLGIVARRKDDIDEAHRQYARALALSSSVRDVEGIVRDLGNLGNVHLAKKRYATAMKFYSKSSRMAQQAGMLEAMAIQLGNMGIVQRHLKRFDDALVHYRAALRMNTRLGRREGIMENVGNIGAVLGDMGHDSQAIRKIDMAISIARKIGEQEGLAVNYELKGELLRKAGLLAASGIAFRASLRHYRKLRHARKVREVSHALRSLKGGRAC